jgi:hypothetical protein
VLWIVAVAFLLPGQIAWMVLLRGARLLDHDAILIGGQALLGVESC